MDIGLPKRIQNFILFQIGMKLESFKILWKGKLQRTPYFALTEMFHLDKIVLF